MNEAMNLWMFILAIWIALESRKVGNKVNVLDIIDQDHQKSMVVVGHCRNCKGNSLMVAATPKM